jgi:hypothetical protein
VEHLERDRPVVLEVPVEVNGGHAPTPELTLERIAAAQRGIEGIPDVSQMDYRTGCPSGYSRGYYLASPVG